MHTGGGRDACPGRSWRRSCPGVFVPLSGVKLVDGRCGAREAVLRFGHDAVVGAAGAGAAGAGAVAAEHLGRGPAVEFHQASFGPAAVQPGVAEVVPEPVREGGHAGLDR
jgi:hypothetical protein